MIPIDEEDDKRFRQNMLRSDMVHLSLLPEQANYLHGYLSASFYFVPREGKDEFEIILKALERALSFHEFCDVKDNHLERVSE